jgi:hypothetical protein
VAVPPAGLPRTVQVGPTDPDKHGTPGIWIYGPPGSIGADADQEADFASRAEALGEALGFPGEENENFSTEWRTKGGTGYEYGDGVTPTATYLTGLCSVDAGDECYRFELDCSNCTLVRGRVAPDAGDQLVSMAERDMQILSQTGWATVIFADDDPVYFGASVTVDLDTSTFTAPDEARERVLGNISEQGHQIDRTYGSRYTDLDNPRLKLDWNTDTVSVTSARYEWYTIVNSTDDENPTSYNVEIRQDARTGELLEFDLRPNAAAQDDGPSDSASTSQGTSATENTSDTNDADRNATEPTDGDGGGPRQTPAPGVLVSALTFAVLAARGTGKRR